MHYQATANEINVSNFLKNKGIIYPWDLQIENVCNIFDIDLELGEVSLALNYNGYKMITLNKKKDEKQRQYEFFHELSHLLNHCGNQDKLPINFRYFQENQADTLALYFAIPYHMLKFLNLQSNEVIREASEMFMLPDSIVYKRLNQIKNKVLSQIKIV